MGSVVVGNVRRSSRRDRPKLAWIAPLQGIAGDSRSPIEPTARVEMFESVGRLTTFAEGDVLLSEGARGDHCFGLVTGEVLATTSSSAGSEVVLGRRRPGDIVGQLSMLDGSPRSARVVARTEVTAQRLTADELEGLLGQHPAFAMEEIRRVGAGCGR